MKLKSIIIDSVAVLLIAFGAWFFIDGFHTETKTVKTYSAATQTASIPAKSEDAAQTSTAAGSSGSKTKSDSNPSAANSKSGSSNDTLSKSSTKSKTGETPASKTATTVSTTQSTSSGAFSSDSGSSIAGSSPNASSEKKAETVSLTVKGYKGTIFSGKYAYHSGDTAFTLLKTAASAEGISLDYSGSGATAYVKGIDGQNEGDKGGMSGWKYKVNGKELNYSAGTYKLKAGDQVVWYYSE
ncbi:DUF4430 domain-containing protein [Weizmannia acidilactici]|uniref:DUF4430 domain-containing protein n=1 Tax=Weizmannia acidilactici TaxID=2607726 RepID=UPI00124F7360|nr:DUF4430 domain-containing protein [Weizmannia acidilactici]GER73641.1 hypothetical protein BpPP18_17080 [Weizmannia acidilactici]